MIKFKHKSDQNCFLYMSPKLGEVMLSMYQWFNSCGYEFVITSVIRKEGEGVSSTHQEGRAFDIRAHHLDPNFISDTLAYFNHKYKNIAAFSKSKNKPTLIIDHGEGANYHFHVQIHTMYENIYAQNFFKQVDEEKIIYN